MPASEEITHLLRAWSDGDGSALAELTPLVYQELHRLAHRYMRQERANHTLQTTALINEAYLRLIGWSNPRWQNRAHFFGVAAGLMRRTLVDFARSRGYAKRRGARFTVSFDEAAILSTDRAREMVDLDEALERLATLDPRKSQIVELRFFGGLSVADTAAIVGVSSRTVLREWDLAKAWLSRELRAK